MLKNFWYAVSLSSELKPQHPVKVRALGQDLVVYRDQSGKPVVMSNYCVHRGGALGDGTVVGDCVVCPYHGWRFDPSGACVEIPANRPGSPVPKRARVDAYPTQERYGLVWAFLGDLPEAERPPLPPFPEYDLPGWRAVHGEFLWQANWARVVENSVDISHTPFVHRNSFGNRDRPQIDDYEITETEYGFNATVTLESPAPKGLWRLVRRQRGSVRATVGIQMPSVTTLALDLGRWKTLLFDANLPIDENTTRTYFVMLRNFFLGSWADQNAIDRALAIFWEDQPIVEAQVPVQVPDDMNAELHVKSDAMAVAFRKQRRRYMERGWRIDIAKQKSEASERLYTLPGPARRDPTLSGAWVMPPVPVRET